jgi:hypothetical protein
MLQVEKQAVRWERFKELVSERGQMDVGAVEMRRYGDCTVGPAPDNDVIVVAVPVVWTSSLISGRKLTGMEDWPVGHSAHAIWGLFRSVPDGCHVVILLDSEDIAAGFDYCASTEAEHDDPLLCCTNIQLHEMYTMMIRKGIHGWTRKSDGEQDADFIRMRMIAVLEAQERTERGVNERDNPSIFLA